MVQQAYFSTLLNLLYDTHERSFHKSPNLTDGEPLISNTGSGMFVLQMDFQQIELFSCEALRRSRERER